MQSKAKQYNAQQCKARNRSISDQVRQHSSHSILVCMGDEPRQYDGSRSMPSVLRPTKGGGKAYPSGDKPDEARTETTSKANPKGYKANVNAGGSKGTKGDGKRSRDGAAEDEEMEKMNTLMPYSFVDFSSSSEDECSPKEEAQTSTAVDGRTSTRH